ARVAACHGRTGAALLRPGEHTLTAHRITEHGRTARPPAGPAARAAAKASFAAVLATRPSRSTSGRSAGTGRAAEQDMQSDV
ncbi:MAG: hypothetical protein ACRDUW_07160, partial [Pseudonocardiaceae bacterium]